MIRVVAQGLLEAKRSAQRTAANLSGEPMVAAMRRAVAVVIADSKVRSPVDAGRLRGSITGDVRQTMTGISGIVGSNVVQSAPMEMGTGTFAGQRPHFPPPRSLTVWARRHGMAGKEFLIARAIFRRGGLEPRKYMRSAIDNKRQTVIRILEEGVQNSIEQS